MVYFNFNRIKTKKTLIGFGLGQILSLLSTSLSFTSSEIARKDFSFFFFSNHPIFKHSHELTKFEIFIGINAPTSQSFLGYVLLAIVYGAKWYHYLLLAFVDVEANFLVVKAYQNTSMTSVMLLDCWAIPCVLVFTWVFLKTKYRLMKISGVVICNVGVVMVVFSDVHAGDRAGGSNLIKGDFLVIAGATLYAVSNVSQEFLVKNADRVQLMSLLGLFGAIIGAIQISIFVGFLFEPPYNVRSSIVARS
ncbi:Solute carrier family 35 member SLC35F1/F2/F6 [Arabidopsis thaliana x Arabidopsis arenosa]|uniref:Solute carrier family 35 member SLC35F1/F2/F6 n=1 Tax=Arabidopsis thaliana x Arabidopsis arenosa TaxID=1240361 RepID=A0A8T2F0U7_9BRAS|nr:Solute carrier family 35 member SLC35F1/F2/F6 [Arabidopsis thaliana x Arabidopsis arenosa]